MSIIIPYEILYWHLIPHMSYGSLCHVEKTVDDKGFSNNTLLKRIIQFKLPLVQIIEQYKYEMETFRHNLQVNKVSIPLYDEDSFDAFLDNDEQEFIDKYF